MLASQNLTKNISVAKSPATVHLFNTATIYSLLCIRRNMLKFAKNIKQIAMKSCLPGQNGLLKE